MGQGKTAHHDAIQRRMLVIFLTFGLSFGVLGYRGFRLHTQNDNKIQGLAARQYTEKVRSLSIRGNIYDRRGHELAVSVATHSLAAHPQQIQRPASWAKKLAPILGISVQRLKKKLSSEKKFVWLKRRLMPDELKKIKELNLTGLVLEKEARRYYPNRELASQVLGAAGYDSEGLGGLELTYDDHLRSPASDDVAYRDARGKIFELEDDPLKARDVSHVYLTIDKNIQYAAETELVSAAHRWNIRRGSIVVMEPQTGAILAVASYPRFNPNSYSEYNLERWRNTAVVDQFEPGSSFKAITAAAALELGLAHPEDLFFCENGEIKIGRTVIHDHEKYGDLTLAEIIKFSSNIGVAKLARQIGSDKLFDFIRRFGFGQTTDIDFPGESTGQICDPSDWHAVDLATMAFGQGLSVTALQMASAYATISNRGRRMKPYLVQKIVRADGELVRQTKPISLGQVIQPETAEQTLSLLEGVTQEGGTGVRAAITGYRVAGKTGTAQQYDLKKKGYSDSEYYSSFVGAAPLPDPQLVVFVGLDRPQNQTYGGVVAAPIFRNVMSAALHQLRIPPQQGTLPLLIAEQEAKSAPDAPSIPVNGHKMIPDFSGLSIRQVLSLGEGRELSIDIEGSGTAYRQEPSPGNVLKKGEICRVYFRQAS